MNVRRALVPAAVNLFPPTLREKLYGEAWLKEQVFLGLREHEDGFCLRSQPLPYLEIQFVVENRLPIHLQIVGAAVEVWLGKPVIQYYTYISDFVRANDRRDTLRTYTFLNNFQLELLNPNKKNTLPPNVTLNLTASFRSSLGPFEKTVRTSWVTPKILTG